MQPWVVVLLVTLGYLGLSLAVGLSAYALKDSEQIPFEDLQAFTEVFSKVKSRHVR